MGARESPPVALELRVSPPGNSGVIPVEDLHWGLRDHCGDLGVVTGYAGVTAEYGEKT